MKRAKRSLKAGLLTAIAVCWLVPIVSVVTLMGVLLGRSYRQSVQQEISAEAESAVGRVQIYLQRAVEDSKQVSYDGVVRSAYRQYQQDGLGISLYRSVNDYLNQRLARDKKYQVVFISFWTGGIAQSYVLGGSDTGREIISTVQEHTPVILESMAEVDTGIRFLLLDGELYMARNLLDSSFTAYATVVMVFDAAYMFAPLMELDVPGGPEITVDTCVFRLDPEGVLTEPEAQSEVSNRIVYDAPVDGYGFSAAIEMAEYRFWEANPWMGWTAAVAAALVLPFLIAAIVLFTRHVGNPMQTLAQANGRVQSGERGYQITQQPPNMEFESLYVNFNEMSQELKNQFERSVMEQQAAQQAQIKALQYQISPHFLNNTLEIINWEARLAGNERVGAMIEALSTMLDAALDRNDQSSIPLRDELRYVDAYLYIIRERLGEGVRIYKEIDETILDQAIPRMILQPIVENAVEHDITSRNEGSLWVRAYQGGGRTILEVEHDGTLTEADRENIAALLSNASPEGSRVGLRNVCRRLLLLYGQEGGLQIEETAAGTIVARISLPAVKSR